MYTKEQLEIAYDKLYERADAFIKKYNPCKMTCSGCMRSRDFCCSGCKHLGEKGCTIKALTCKTWFCGSVKLTKESYKELSEIIQLTNLLHFRGFRFTKEQSIKQSLERQNQSIYA
jgi:hypothetical protein